MRFSSPNQGVQSIKAVYFDATYIKSLASFIVLQLSILFASGLLVKVAKFCEEHYEICKAKDSFLVSEY